MSTAPDDLNTGLGAVGDDSADDQARLDYLVRQGQVRSVDAGVLETLQARAATADRITTELARILGADEDVDTDALLASLNTTLTELASAPAVPDGVEMVDTATLADLRAAAELHRTTRERNLVEAAIHDGRIPPAARASWTTLLQNDPDGASAKTLAGLTKGTIPVDGPRGYTGTPRDLGELGPGDELAALFPDDETA